ncbi:hypothetical protein DI09_17p120 [Mitosporidium daphniae]|uniref:KHDC4/BBP-like KH-domain type I domain-containing protein n=1 Tax=Mitosporidium daphniae TaxID=1485682 RepID=A0A098VTW4_9MICR|nr:uncharacterized protein DI09_17p120 [Mitosporidium daphniae]KGG52382.1 hypothetical protein DI09_17p120 [Mitosporidium daphniae]|eukprot:XP_013238809.1 uncharacterized protein DI09_17p120 [Mitosporidium daphniae]
MGLDPNQNPSLPNTKRRRRWDESAPTDTPPSLPFIAPSNNAQSSFSIDPSNAAKEAADRINQLLCKKTASQLEVVKDQLEEPKAAKETHPIQKSKPIANEEDDMLPSQYIHIKDPLYENPEAYFRIMEDSGAKIETKGKYYSDKSDCNEYSEPPLYIRISSEVSDEPVLEALKIIKVLIQKSLAKDASKPQLSSFGYGANIKAINAKTKARVQIKGRGSGYSETDTSIEGPSQESIETARKLCHDLISDVKKELETYKKSSYSSHNNQQTSSGYSSTLMQTVSSSYGVSNNVLPDASNALYAYYYQYYFNSLGEAVPSESVKNDPAAAFLELQQRQQYAAYYASVALNSASSTCQVVQNSAAPKDEEIDPFAIGSSNDYRSVPPPPNLYK